MQWLCRSRLKPLDQEYVLTKITFRLHTPTPPPSLTEGSIYSAFQTPQNPRQLDHKIHSLQKRLSTKRKLSSCPISHSQRLEKAAQMAMKYKSSFTARN
jgi:hypothetical protein